MTVDAIDAAFAGLDRYYPGSKRKIPQAKEKDIAVKEDSWDAVSYKKTLPNGTPVEMFTIGALASALGRPVITIRKWTTMGYLPVSPYRLPSVKTAKGLDHSGRRLYTRPMIEATISLFTKAGLMGVSRIEWSNYQQLSQDLAEAWRKIRAQETQQTDTN